MYKKRATCCKQQEAKKVRKTEEWKRFPRPQTATVARSLARALYKRREVCFERTVTSRRNVQSGTLDPFHTYMDPASFPKVPAYFIICSSDTGPIVSPLVFW